MAIRVSYTKYQNCPGASFWSFMQTMGAITLGLAALFGAMGISLGFDLKPIWSVLTFIGCFALAIVGIIYFMKLTKIMINRALNKTWNQMVQAEYDKGLDKLQQDLAEEMKKTEHAYICFRCGTIKGYPYKYHGKCEKCNSHLFFTGYNILGWNDLPEAERQRMIQLMRGYQE
ncbi:MAG: hypothetical protein J6U30_06490 [Oscillospiraceae bacterium]|nr:hypothetical protein [Oscillospiraceae bacterium]